MKLLQIGPYPPPVGGWSFHIKVFKKYLDSLDINNDVLDIGESRKVKGRECIDVQGVVDYIVKVFGFCRRRYRIYIHLNGNTTMGFFLTLLAQLLGLITCQRCLLSFHAGTLQKCFEKGLSIHKILAILSFKLSGGIICNSESVKHEIVAFGIRYENVYPIPCFSMQYIKHDHELTVEEENFCNNHSPLFSSYVFFREEYDPDTLFEALRLLKKEYPSFGALIIGSLEGVAPYKQKIVQFALETNVLLAGEKKHDNFLSIVERSDLVIRTPMSDGVCSSVMEALALKIPVVASDNHTRPQEVTLFEAGNVESLTGKVVETMRNLDKVKESLADTVQRDAIQEELEFLMKFS